MSARADGGPAFPIPMSLAIKGPCNESEITAVVEARALELRGATLRDYFAAKAMQGELASQPDYEDIYVTAKGVKNLAEWCYKMADAMLKAREA